MEEKSLIHIIPILWRYKVLITGSVLIAGLIASVIMLLKPNFYKSSTTFYPVNNVLLEPAIQIQNRPIDYYGDDRDVDRLLSIAKSNEIAQKILGDLDLASHYDIKTDSKKGQIQLLKKFRKLSNIQKTQFDAIELSVEDEDPEMAQKTTVLMRSLINEKAKEIINQSQQRLLQNLKTTQNSNISQIRTVTDSLNSLRKKFGIYDTKSQAEALATLEINSPGSTRIQNKIENYSAGIAQVTNLEAMQNELNEGHAKVALQIQQIEASMNSDDPAIHIIEKAFLPIEKSRPRRSLYVLGTMLLIGFLSVVLVLIREQLQTITLDS